jgi:hypothetical protein
MVESISDPDDINGPRLNWRQAVWDHVIITVASLKAPVFSNQYTKTSSIAWIHDNMTSYKTMDLPDYSGQCLCEEFSA